MTTHPVRSILLVLFAIVIAYAAPGSPVSVQVTLAETSILYGIDSSTDSLYSIDIDTGERTIIGRLDPNGAPTNINPNRFATPIGLTTDTNTGKLLAWNSSACIGDPGASCSSTYLATGDLVEVDPVTGAGTVIGQSTDLGLSDLAFNPVTGDLFGISSSLYSIDVNTAATTLIASIRDDQSSTVRMSGAAFDASGTLYALQLVNTGGQASGAARLFTVNTLTGQANEIGSINLPGLTGGIVFLPDGTLLGSATDLGLIFDIDPATAAVSNLRGAGLAQGLAVTGAPPPPVPQENFALDFDGVDDFVSIADVNGDFDFAKEFTVEARVWPRSVGDPVAYAGIVRGAFSEPPPISGGGWVLYTQRRDRSDWGLSVCVSECNAALSGPGSLVPDQWHHLAATYNGSAITIFLNGDEIGNVAHPGDVTNINFVVLGFWAIAFDGVIDEVRLWNVARSQVDIQANMDASLTGQEPGLVGYWPLNEGEGQTVGDATGRGNEGRLGTLDQSDGYDPQWILVDDLVIDQPGSITINKFTDPAGGTGFDFTSDIPGAESFTLDHMGTMTIQDVPAGVYTVTEVDPSPSHLLESLSCQEDQSGSTWDVAARTATIDLDAGEEVTCNFVNSAPPPAEGREITLISTADDPDIGNWQQLIEGFGFEFASMSIEEVENANLEGVRTFIIGSEVSPTQWTSGIVQVLEQTNVPVVGVGNGGVGYFSNLSLELGNVSGVQEYIAAGPIILDFLSPLFFFCDAGLNIASNLSDLNIYDVPTMQLSVIPSSLDGVDVVATDSSNSGAATLAVEDGQYIYYGFPEPQNLTEAGEGLLRGTLAHAVELGNETISAENVSLVNWDEENLQQLNYNFLLPDITVDNLEITQAIQCLNSTVVGCEGGDNSLPLATNRSTAVRVYLRLARVTQFLNTIADVAVRLHVMAGSGAGAEVFTIDSAGTAVENPQRTDVTHTANFFLSIDGPGDIPVRMCAVIDPDNDIAEFDEANNRFPIIGSVAKLFEERRPIEIDAMPIDYRVNAADPANVPNNAEVTTNSAPFLNRIWPVPDQPTGIDYQVLSPLLWVQSTDGNLGSRTPQHDLIQELTGLWGLANILSAFLGGDVPISNFLYGWVPASISDIGGHADMPNKPHAGGFGVVSIGTDAVGTNAVTPSRAAGIFAHEFTHNIEELHTNTGDGCGSLDGSADFPYISSNIQEVGFDPVTGVVMDPANTHDVMSYCPGAGTVNAWISPFTWNKIWDDFDPDGGSNAIGLSSASDSSDAAPAAALDESTDQLIMVLGNVQKEADTGELAFAYVVPDGGIQIFDSHDGHTDGEHEQYEVLLKDADGNVLATHSFDVVFRSYSVPFAPETDEASFVLTLPLPDAVTRLELQHNGVTLDTLDATGIAPEAFIDPIGNGDPLELPTLVNWNDTGNGNIYAAFFNPGNGKDIVPLGLALSASEIWIDPLTLPSTDNGQIILLASNGFDTSQSSSEPFAIVDKPPTVGISEPGDGDAFSARSAIVFVGVGFDTDDGSLPADGLNWSSDLDGFLGTGNVLPTPPSASDGLSQGNHIITLTGTDSAGNVSSTSIGITVLAPPTVSLSASPHVGLAPLSVMLEADASDADGTVVLYQWDFESDGVINSTSTVSHISHVYDADGIFTASVSVVDDDGLVSHASTDIGVGDDACQTMDNLPPELSVSLTPASPLWPPNHKYVSMALTVQVSDSCDASPEVNAVAQSDEMDDEPGDGDGETTGDVQVTTPGGDVHVSSNTTPSVSFDPQNDTLEFRAERSGSGDGRTYTVEVTATDEFGNSVVIAVQVTVAHDER